MSVTEKRPKTGLIMLSLSITFIVGVVWLFRYTNQKELERKNERINQEVRKLQEEVSTYIIENYEGVEKIEWLGWSISPLSEEPDTAMTINGYEDEVNGKVQFSYLLGSDQDFFSYTDRQLQDTRNFKGNVNYVNMGIKKSDKGSPNAKIIYNYEEDK